MKTTQKGFTLIELLIVISIIGILAVAFLPSLLGAPAKGRDAQRLATVQKVNNFIVSQSLAGATIPDTECILKADVAVAASISKLINDNLADFGGVFPADPDGANTNGGATVGCAAADTGGYGFVKYTNAAKKYTTGVYTHVEVKTNGNIKCASIADNADPAANIGEDIEANDEACYLTLFQ